MRVDAKKVVIFWENLIFVKIFKKKLGKHFFLSKSIENTLNQFAMNFWAGLRVMFIFGKKNINFHFFTFLPKVVSFTPKTCI